MRKLWFIISKGLIMLPILLSGCEEDLDLSQFKEDVIENMLVVNSILNPDSLIGVSVTHPYFFSDPHTTFPPITDLEIHVKIDNKDWKSLKYDPTSKLYIGNRKPKEGEEVRLRVKGRGKEVTTCDTIPSKVEIESIEAFAEGPMHIFWDNDYRFVYKITFQDNPKEANFYFLSIEDDALPYELSEMGQVDYTTDYVFQMLANMINKDGEGWRPGEIFGYPFSDKGIDGERYTITVCEVLQTPLVWMIEHLPRKVKLYSISRSYFEYMLSVLALDYESSALKGYLLSLGLSEPTQIYSNVTGGCGLMGSYNLNTVHIDLLQLTGGWP